MTELKTFKLTLGGVTYTCRKFNLGQLRRLAQMQRTMDQMDLGFAVLEMAFDGSEPPLPEGGLDAIQADHHELAAALTAVQQAAGITVAEGGNTGEAPAPEEAVT